jgi:NAD(P)-dependent dehydrogenase (short-subunit alcohol dehydrogenase family)
MRLKDKVAIVTGASSGIGKAIALAFGKEGALVFLAARNTEAIDTLEKEISNAGGKALAVPTDVSQEDQILSMYEKTLKAFGKIDILVNSAGAGQRVPSADRSRGVPSTELTLAKWNDVLQVNLTGAFLCSREALKLMKPVKSGRIINIGSTASKVPRADALAYTVSKFGLEGLTKSLALDSRDHGISVSILHPGNTESGIWAGNQEQVREKDGMMAASDVAEVVVTMAAMPSNVNLFEALMLPLKMPFLGRG